MRVGGLLAAMVLGCAGRNLPPVATPGPCVCVPSTCTTAVVAATPPLKPTTPVSWLPNPSATATAAVDPTSHPELEGVMERRLLHAAIATSNQCSSVQVTASAFMADAEPDILRKVREARSRREYDDGTPLVERDMRAWAEYEEAIAPVVPKLAAAVKDDLSRAIMKSPKVEAVIEASVEQVFGTNYPYEPKSYFIELGRAGATRIAAKTLREAASACADTLLSSYRGRWIAVLKGKA